MTTRTDDPPGRPACRWCRMPVRPIVTGSRQEWIHRGPGGAFACRDRLSGMLLPTFAAPATEPGDDRAVGRHPVRGIDPDARG